MPDSEPDQAELVAPTKRNTIARRSLYRYHFRDEDIDRLFPEPDFVTETGQPRYSGERVQKALDTDEVLRRRIRACQIRKERQLAEIARSGGVVLRWVEGRELLMGEHLEEGTIVTVTYSPGDVRPVGVGALAGAVVIREGIFELAEPLRPRRTKELAKRLAGNGASDAE